MTASVGSKRRWKEIRDELGQEELVSDIVVQMASLRSQGGAKRMCTDTDPALLQPELDDRRISCVVPIGRSMEVSESSRCHNPVTALHPSAALIILKNRGVVEGGGDGDGMVTEDVATVLGCEMLPDS